VYLQDEKWTRLLERLSMAGIFFYSRVFKQSIPSTILGKYSWHYLVVPERRSHPLKQFKLPCSTFSLSVGSSLLLRA
jgi:hypothetical protein